jgi:pimeloyl-ACP methyl ester carboxylesterase
MTARFSQNQRNTGGHRPPLQRSRRVGRTFLLLAIAVLFIAARRGLLVAFLGLKILGHPAGLDSWKGAVRYETIQHAGIPIDIYTGSGRQSPLLIIHGVNPTGKDSVDLKRISAALAQTGYKVFVPDLVEMKHQHLDPEETTRIKSIFKFIGADAALACFSYGCGPALIAAADPELRDHVRYALAFGGYYDIRETLESVVTNPKSDIVYWKWVFVGANVDLIAAESDRSLLKEIAARRAGGKDDGGLSAQLSPQGKAMVGIFAAQSRERLADILKAAPESLQTRMDALSPSKIIRDIRAPLILVHGINDTVIPSEQSIHFAEAAKSHGLKYSLTLLGTYGHMNPIMPELTLSSFFGFYLPETMRFLRVVNQVAGRV